VALGCATPAYAHLPIILNLNGSKMSKRDKDKAVREAVRAATRSGRLDPRRARELAGCDEAAFESWMKKKTQLDNDGLARLARELCVELPEIEVHDFRAAGYLPESLLNFLALLGWSPGDDREKFTLDELVAAFRVERIGKSSARFDRAKLLNFNTTAVASGDPERLLAGLCDWLAVNPASPLARGDEPALRRTLELCQGFRVFRDVESKARALFVEDEEVSYDPTVVEKELLKGEPSGARMLETVRRELAAVDEWRRDELEAALTRFVEQRGLKLGKVAQPLRVAVTGTTISPAIFDTLEMLGKQRVLRRVDRALAHAATSSS
jgi:glutamyl-tRNA synthetase